ncbi:MAG TPA: S8 family serine peptidase [Pseudoneobacillus sp.]|nr:S8 family serine peptidase [Pseudoneobacillus sp.]
MEFKLPPFKIESTQEAVNEIPWGVQMINAPTIWNETQGEDVVVCILDTGIKKDHPDLKDRIIEGVHGGQNFTMDYQGEPNMWEDNNGHGTHVAGTIAASFDNQGVVGVAPKVKLLIGKVLNQDGMGSLTSIAKAIRWAADWQLDGKKVRVISMSLGGPSDSIELHEAVKYAVSKGIVIVCAAGNSGDGNTGTNEFAYPGVYPEVIEVAAIDNQKRLATFSNTNSEIDVAAPGVSILSTTKDGLYGFMSGTSMATPHVAGAVALLINLYEKRLNKTLNVDEIRQVLKQHTQDTVIDATGEGAGIVDLAKEYIAPQPKRLVKMWINQHTVEDNGKILQVGQPPIIVNDTTYLPVRFLAELLGARVDWDQENQRVTLTWY